MPTICSYEGFEGTTPPKGGPHYVPAGSLCNGSYTEASLDLDRTSLSGYLPTQLALLTSIELIELQRNSLSGTLPTQLGNLTSVKHFSVLANPISGVVPVQLAALKNATNLCAAATLAADRRLRPPQRCTVALQVPLPQSV